MSSLNEWLVLTNNFVWTYFVVALCVIAGMYCTIRLGFVQFRSLPHALELLRGKHSEGSGANDISTLQALATTLASTTGIGNIAGVAVAIKLGGPAAIFWMWVMAILGMALKFVEATLGSYYRQPEPNGQKDTFVGGPMYYMAKGLGPKWRPIALTYAALGAVAFLGAWNMFQANQASAIIKDQFDIPLWVTSLTLTVLSGLVLIGGIHRIGQVASKIVPSMCFIYLGGVVLILIMNFSAVPDAFALIITDVFNPSSATGGVVGTAIIMGIRRAIFSNEAGAGSAAIAFAAAHTKHPARQGIVAGLGPFIDTVIVCTATALVILTAGFYGSESHQAVTKQPLPLTTQANTHWISTDQVPAQHKSLQSLVSGQKTLHTDTNNATLTLPLYALLAEGQLTEAGDVERIDGLRLSLRLNQATVTAALVNQDGDVAVEQKLTPRNNAQWQSFVLPLPDQSQQLQQWQLTLTPTLDAGGTVYVDRVQLVNDVTGIVLSSSAFAHYLGVFGTIFVPLAGLIFAFTTIIAGSYYGEVSSQYLNPKLLKPYMWLYVVSIFIGGVMNLEIIINFSDLSLALACIPNLIAMMILCPLAAKEYKKYNAEMQAKSHTTEDQST